MGRPGLKRRPRCCRTTRSANTATSSSRPTIDEKIIAGQSDLRLELSRQFPDGNLVLSPVSGGGLLLEPGSSRSREAASSNAKSAWCRGPNWPAIRPRAFAPGNIVEWPAGN